MPAASGETDLWTTALMYWRTSASHNEMRWAVHNILNDSNRKPQTSAGSWWQLYWEGGQRSTFKLSDVGLFLPLQCAASCSAAPRSKPCNSHLELFTVVNVNSQASFYASYSKYFHAYYVLTFKCLKTISALLRSVRRRINKYYIYFISFINLLWKLNCTIHTRRYMFGCLVQTI